MTWKGCCNHSKRRGLTLIEVVVGIALLSTLLVAILVSYRAHAGQIRSAKLRLRAIAYADEQMSLWMTVGNPPPVGDSGESADGTLAWRIVSGTAQADRRFGYRVARLEILPAAAQRRGAILASVEYLVPDLKKRTP